MRLEQSKLLQKVTVTGLRNSAISGSGESVNDAIVARVYHLDYAAFAAGSRQPRLVAVQECNNDARTVCYPKTRFTWNESPNSEPTDLLNPGLASSYPQLTDAKDLKVGDINGDGRQDLVWADRSFIACSARSPTA
jgi:hypothetical protein